MQKNTDANNHKFKLAVYQLQTLFTDRESLYKPINSVFKQTTDLEMLPHCNYYLKFNIETGAESPVTIRVI